MKKYLVIAVLNAQLENIYYSLLIKNNCLSWKINSLIFYRNATINLNGL